jgi:hypothetical protein
MNATQRRLASVSALLAMMVPCVGQANVTYRVRMNTHAWKNTQGYVVIAMTSGLKGTTESIQGACVRGFKNDGYRGIAFKTGGGYGGDLVYNVGQAAANCTGLSNFEPNQFYPAHKYFYAHVVGNFGWRESSDIGIPVFGDSVVFDLELPLPTVSRNGFQDEFYVQVLNDQEQPGFQTADPFGADAICAFTAPPSGGGAWLVDVFTPATLTAAQGADPATINVTFPAPPGGGGGGEDPVEPPIIRPPHFAAVSPNPSSSDVRFEYTIGEGRPKVRLAIYDLRGRLIKNYNLGPQPAGRWTAVWDRTDNAGREVSSGVYFARLQVAGWKDQRKVLLAP